MKVILRNRIIFIRKEIIALYLFFVKKIKIVKKNTPIPHVISEVVWELSNYFFIFKCYKSLNFIFLYKILISKFQ